MTCTSMACQVAAERTNANFYTSPTLCTDYKLQYLRDHSYITSDYVIICKKIKVWQGRLNFSTKII